MATTDTVEPKLPYATRPLTMHGTTVEVYLIPDDKKAEVLERG